MANNRDSDQSNLIKRLENLEQKVSKKNKNSTLNIISTIASVLAILISFAFGIYNIHYTLEIKEQEDLEKTLSNLEKGLKELDQLNNSDFQNYQFRQSARRELVLSILRSKMKRNSEYIEFVGSNTLMMLGDQMLFEPNMKEALSFYEQALNKESNPEMRSYAYGSLGHFYGLNSVFKNLTKKYGYWSKQMASLDSIKTPDKSIYVATAYHSMCQSEYVFDELDSANKYLELAREYYSKTSLEQGLSALRELEYLYIRENIRMNNLFLPLNQNSMHTYLRKKFHLAIGNSLEPYFDNNTGLNESIDSEFVQNLLHFDVDSVHKLDVLISDDIVKLIENQEITNRLNFGGIIDAALFIEFGDDYLNQIGFVSKEEFGTATNELIDRAFESLN